MSRYHSVGSVSRLSKMAQFDGYNCQLCQRASAPADMSSVSRNIGTWKYAELLGLGKLVTKCRQLREFVSWGLRLNP